MGKNFVAGLGAGVTEALLIVAPVETVKTKVIELNMPFLTGLKHIIKTEGFGGVYQGVGQLDFFFLSVMAVRDTKSKVISQNRKLHPFLTLLLITA